MKESEVLKTEDSESELLCTDSTALIFIHFYGRFEGQRGLQLQGQEVLENHAQYIPQDLNLPLLVSINSSIT
jgi:hypothetical protein